MEFPSLKFERQLIKYISTVCPPVFNLDTFLLSPGGTFTSLDGTLEFQGGKWHFFLPLKTQFFKFSWVGEEEVTTHCSRRMPSPPVSPFEINIDYLDFRLLSYQNYSPIWYIFLLYQAAVIMTVKYYKRFETLA